MVGNSYNVSFWEFTQTIEGMDIEYNGLPYTWSNNWKGIQNIRERLDKVICCLEWRILFLGVGIQNLVSSQSNHYPILHYTANDKDQNYRPFRFFNTWFWDPICKEVIQEAQEVNCKGLPLYKLTQKSKSVKRQLKDWNWLVFGYTHTRIQQLTQQIEQLKSLPLTRDNLDI